MGRGGWSHRRSHGLAGSLAAVVVMACGVSGQPEPQDRPLEEPASYSVRGQAQALLIDLDEVGLVVHSGVTETDIAEISREHGLEPTGRLGEWMYILRLADLPDSHEAETPSDAQPTDYDLDDDGDVDRLDLLQIAMTLEHDHPALILEAGLLVREPGSGARMILSEKLSVRLHDETLASAFAQRLATHTAPGYDGREYEVEPAGHESSTRWFAVNHVGGEDPLEHQALLSSIEGVDEVVPSFIRPVEDRSAPAEDLRPLQWHHENTGGKCPDETTCRGTEDADLDTPEAWELTKGSPEVVIAVIDTHGYDVDHPDLVGRLWNDPANPDVHGRNFRTHPPGTDVEDAGIHGTAVAGCAVAPDDGLGVTGTCPDCTLMLVVNGVKDDDIADAIDWVWRHDADVLVCSWGFLSGFKMPGVVRQAVEDAATLGRGGKGTVVVWASKDNKEYMCSSDLLDVSGLPDVLGVSGSTDADERLDKTGFGPCLDVLGPTRHREGSPVQGYQSVVTTDVQGLPGYNTNKPVDFEGGNPCGCPEVTGSADATAYTLCFGGTSASTPLIGGVAGLILAADAENDGTSDSDLLAAEVRRVLHDTCDKIDDKAGFYDVETGYSKPPTDFDPDTGSDPVYAPTHTFGRVNGYEAVKLVASASVGGRAGVDVFVRDNRLDWGNTEKPSNYLFESCRGFIPHWQSVDIKVDAPDANGDYATPPTADTFADFVDEDPLPGVANQVYVRVRNRGPDTTKGVDVKLFWAEGGSAQPAVPDDFWSAFPADPSDTSRWHPAAVGSLGSAGATANTVTLDELVYSGATAARDAAETKGVADSAAIASFSFEPPAVAAGLEAVQHYALLAMVGGDDDKLQAEGEIDAVVPTNNNVTLRNVRRVSASAGGTGGQNGFTALVWIANTSAVDITTKLSGLDDAALNLRAWMLSGVGGLDPQHPENNGTEFVPGTPFTLNAGVRVPVLVQVDTKTAEGELSLVQSVVDGTVERILGGVTYILQP